MSTVRPVGDQIEREIVIAAPIERVWAVLTQAEHIGAWFANNGAEIDLRPGGRLEFRWREHGRFLATIERVEPPHLFAYRWALNPEEQPGDGNSTLVEFTLESVHDGAGTRLRVVERGFQSLAGSESERAVHLENNTDGWIGGLDSIRAYAERAAA